MSVTMRMRLFKNTNKEPGDNKPPYSNSNFTVQERVVLEPGVAYTAGLWKDEKNDSLNLRVDERNFQCLKAEVHQCSQDNQNQQKKYPSNGLVYIINDQRNFFVTCFCNYNGMGNR